MNRSTVKILTSLSSTSENPSYYASPAGAGRTGRSSLEEKPAQWHQVQTHLCVCKEYKEAQISDILETSSTHPELDTAVFMRTYYRK